VLPYDQNWELSTWYFISQNMDIKNWGY
jgi:hypothetical protein